MIYKLGQRLFSDLRMNISVYLREIQPFLIWDLVLTCQLSPEGVKSVGSPNALPAEKVDLPVITKGSPDNFFFKSW